MKKNYGKRMDSNRSNKNERKVRKNKSFKFNFDFKKASKVTLKTLATTYVVALVVFFIFLISITPGVFDILQARKAADAANRSISVSAEEAAEKRVAYQNKIQHYVESVNNMQNLNLLQKLQNSAISEVAKIDVKLNNNLTITAVEAYELAVVAYPIIVFLSIMVSKKVKNIKKIKSKEEAATELKLLAS